MIKNPNLKIFLIFRTDSIDDDDHGDGEEYDDDDGDDDDYDDDDI